MVNEQSRVRQVAVDRMVDTLGGAARSDPLPESASEKEERRRRKQEAKFRRDAERQPASFERYKILMDVADEGRRIVELADHKARYGLLVMGVLNAVVFFVVSRLHVIGELPPGPRIWVIGMLVAYAALSAGFTLQAIDCLRPRRLRYDEVIAREGAGSIPDRHRPLGLLFWEPIARQDLAHYGCAWSSVRMEQLNAEAVVISHHLSFVIQQKYRALYRLYWGLAILAILAVVLLGVTTAFALFV